MVGSNIFNILLCLSTAALAGTVGGRLPALAIDMAVLVAMTLLAATFIRSERTITRMEGAVALATYIVFTAYVVLGA